MLQNQGCEHVLEHSVTLQQSSDFMILSDVQSPGREKNLSEKRVHAALL